MLNPSRAEEVTIPSSPLQHMIESGPRRDGHVMVASLPFSPVRFRFPSSTFGPRQEIHVHVSPKRFSPAHPWRIVGNRRGEDEAKDPSRIGSSPFDILSYSSFFGRRKETIFGFPTNLSKGEEEDGVGDPRDRWSYGTGHEEGWKDDVGLDEGRSHVIT